MFLCEVAEGQEVVIEALGAPDLNVMSAFHQTGDMRVQCPPAPAAGEVVPHGNSKRRGDLHLTILPRRCFG